jgi:hypothetical protein
MRKLFPRRPDTGVRCRSASGRNPTTKETRRGAVDSCPGVHAAPLERGTEDSGRRVESQPGSVPASPALPAGVQGDRAIRLPCRISDRSALSDPRSHPGVVPSTVFVSAPNPPRMRMVAFSHQVTSPRPQTAIAIERFHQRRRPSRRGGCGARMWVAAIRDRSHQRRRPNRRLRGAGWTLSTDRRPPRHADHPLGE